jgi:hypothetical protein
LVYTIPHTLIFTLSALKIYFSGRSFMSAVQDVGTVVANAPVMQTVASRDADVGRAQNLFADNLRQEQHRQGNEAVAASAQAEGNNVNPDGGGSGQPSRRQAKKKAKAVADDPKHGWRMGVDNDGLPHLVNLIG